MLKKCEGRLRRLRVRLSDWLSPDEADFAGENLDEHLTVEEPKITSDEEPEFDLEPVKDFMEEFIGLIIVDMKPFRDDIVGHAIQGKLITGVSVDGNKLKIDVVSVSGNEGGVIELTPTLSGQFAQRFSEDAPADSSRYRIDFLGGFSLEYLDSEDEGNIDYVTRWSEFH